MRRVHVMSLNAGSLDSTGSKPPFLAQSKAPSTFDAEWRLDKLVLLLKFLGFVGCVGGFCVQVN